MKLKKKKGLQDVLLNKNYNVYCLYFVFFFRFSLGKVNFSKNRLTCLKSQRRGTKHCGTFLPLAGPRVHEIYNISFDKFDVENIIGD